MRRFGGKQFNRKEIAVKASRLGVLLFVTLIFCSCIVDEFRFNEVKLSNNWQMDVIAPLFYGHFKFIELVHDSEPVVAVPNESKTTFISPGGSSSSIPTRLIFEPASVIDSFNFLIEGEDYLKSAKFTFTVTNGSPFPLNLRMYFFEKKKPETKGPPFSPPVFAAGQLSADSIVPVTTINELVFTTEQLKSFKSSNRMEFDTWFDPASGTFNPDTLKADYPIDISIVLTGKIINHYE
ncbi:MAG: hypothetical protein J7L95_00125 [Prolixibacteraceae bacterium]|nr:hypothetical protein [Prolixibacteraceae bacterium]